MFEKPLAERMELQLRDFDNKRDAANREIQSIKEEMLKLVKEFFDKLVSDMSPHLGETDSIIESLIVEFKRLDGRKKELDRIREKLVPVLEIFGRGQPITK